MFTPEDILRFLGTRSKWMILYVLYKKGCMSGREISREAGISWMPVGTALVALVDSGLIEYRTEGNKKIYWLNERHFLYHPLKEFFSSLTKSQYQLLDTLRDKFKKWGEPILLNIGLAGDDRLILATKDDVSSKDIVASNISRFLNDLGHKGRSVEIYTIHEIINDHNLRSELDKTCLWIGGDLQRITQVLDGNKADSRLSFFDF